MTARPFEVVLPPTRSLGTAISAIGAAIVVLIFAVALFADPAVSSSQRVGIGLMGGLFAVTLTAVGLTLSRGHGALLLDAPGRRLGLGVTGQDDVWWLALGDVRGLRVVPIAGGDGTTIERWVLVIALDGRPDVVLAESDDRAAILGIGERLSTHLGVADLAEHEPAQAPLPFVTGDQRFAVSRGAAIQGLLAVFGSSLLAFGILAFAEVDKEPVVGFIFAPILIVMGITMLAVPLVKRYAQEALSFDGQRWSHHYEIGRFRWGHRVVTAPTPTFRIRLIGVRGALLELLGSDGSLVIAAGASSKSRLDVEAVSRIPARFRASPAAAPEP